jgi:CDP-glucose 4,6-dehydratase
MGAELIGVSDRVLDAPSLFQEAGVAEGMTNHWIDVRDGERVSEIVRMSHPEILVHMAAQSLVGVGYAQPLLTYETNVMGTVNVLEAVRRSPETRVVVVVTSDKCYDNRDHSRRHAEGDAMGGTDPYSSSKGCAELVTGAYRDSYLAGSDCRVASVRAGNVIGGGDWSTDRLAADAMRAALCGETLHVRSPDSIRPWQHVLNPLGGYLVLAQALWDRPDLAGGWNFGPGDHDAVSVRSLLEMIRARWPDTLSWSPDGGAHPFEPVALQIDSTRARDVLGWDPPWDIRRGVDALVAWFVEFRSHSDMRAVSLGQIAAFGQESSPSREPDGAPVG